MIYLENDVFQEALQRIRFIYDNHDDVIVSMSGGKDSTVLFRMALMKKRRYIGRWNLEMRQFRGEETGSGWKRVKT